MERDVILAKQGNQQAFTRLYNNNIKYIVQMLNRWAHEYNDAEDIAQDAMTKAFKNINQFKGDSKFHTWIWRIAKNHAINHHERWTNRRPPRQDIDYTEVYLKNTESPESIIEEMDIEKHIVNVLNESSDEVRYIFLEKISSSDFSYEKMAKDLDIPVGTVRSRIFRVKDRILRGTDNE